MKFYLILTYLTILISIIVAYHYRKDKLNLFFFLLAATDVLGILFGIIFPLLSGQAFWIPLNYLIIFSVNKELFLKWKYYIFIGMIPFVIFNLYATNKMQQIFVLIVCVILTIIFTKYFITDFVQARVFNFFYLVIIFEEIMQVIVFTSVVINIELGMNIFYVGIIFQIILNILLLFIRDKRSISLT